MHSGVLLEFLNMGGGEVMVIMIVVLLLFGGKKLPELARGLGKGIREFKDASEGVKREIHRNINNLELDKELEEEEARERELEAAREAERNAGRHHLSEAEDTLIAPEQEQEIPITKKRGSKKSSAKKENETEI